MTVFKEKDERESWEMCQHISQAHDSMKGNHYGTPGSSHIEKILQTKTVTVQCDSFISTNLPNGNDPHTDNHS